MHIEPDCIVCIMNQTLKTAKLLGCDNETAKRLLDSTAEILRDATLEMTPPQIAKETYAAIARITATPDPLLEAKKEVTQLAEKVNTASIRTLEEAVRFAAIGNVIDFGAQRTFDLDETIRSHLSRDFAINDFDTFEKELHDARTFVYIGDNTGEHLFDKRLIEMIVSLYDIKVYYFVRGKPIINDVTVEEARVLGDVAEIVDTGVPTPGYDLRYADTRSRELFETADIVLSKGMGNYESLYDVCDRSVYYLFMVKCDVVARSIRLNVGDMVFAKH